MNRAKNRRLTLLGVIVVGAATMAFARVMTATTTAIAATIAVDDPRDR